MKRTVLVADDEAVNRLILTHMLEGEYGIIEAVDGEDAMEKIRENRKVLSLIMLDLLMPKISGYDVLRALQDYPELKQIPVIVMTSEKEAEVETLRLGAVDFLQKGRDLPEVILARVRRNIELAEDRMIIRSTENDELTGLYNREFFFEYARLMMQSDEDARMDAITLNIDRFQNINRLYGRKFGDEVLRKVAELTHRILRNARGIACRTEADTFFIYRENMEDYGQLERIVREGMKEIPGTAGIRVRIGIYPDADRTLSVEQQFDRSRNACSSVRNDYTKAIAFFDEEQETRRRYEDTLVADFPQALEEEQIEIFFQPQYNIRRQPPVLTGAEALARWNHPDLGRINPAEFIPLFEENGLVRKLDEYVWRQAAALMRRWKDRCGRAFPVSVNISRVDIYNESLVPILTGLMEEYRLDPADYRLEITESAYVGDDPQIMGRIGQLREYGFPIEMDDFGTGYSSLHALTEIPLDILKVDMKFVQQITADPQSHRMLEIIRQIADASGVETVAEGVETEEQMEVLRGIGYDLAQGYFFSRPISADAMEQILKETAVEQEERS